MKHESILDDVFMHTPNGDPTNLTGSRRGGITAQSEPTAWGAVGPPGEAEVSRLFC